MGKRAIHYFDSDRNQLAYSGTPGTYDYTMTTEIDSTYDDDGVPVRTNMFWFSWQPLDKLYSPVYLRFRVRNDQLSTQTNWSVPTKVYTDVRYGVYKRRLASVSKSWELIEITRVPSVGPYQESWAGRVQYAVCIYHVDGIPGPSEGLLGPTDFTNPYVLFATDPNDSDMNTRPYLVK